MLKVRTLLSYNARLEGNSCHFDDARTTSGDNYEEGVVWPFSNPQGPRSQQHAQPAGHQAERLQSLLEVDTECYVGAFTGSLVAVCLNQNQHASARSQHAVNTQSTRSQHTVNTQSTQQIFAGMLIGICMRELKIFIYFI